MADRRVRVRIVGVAVVRELVTYDAGHWCSDCALPSGIRAWVAVRWAGGMHLQTQIYCDECGGHRIHAAPPS